MQNNLHSRFSVVSIEISQRYLLLSFMISCDYRKLTFNTEFSARLPGDYPPIAMEQNCVAERTPTVILSRGRLTERSSLVSSSLVQQPVFCGGSGVKQTCHPPLSPHTDRLNCCPVCNPLWL